MLSARVAASEGALSCPATQSFIPVFTPGKTYQQHACPRARVLFQRLLFQSLDALRVCGGTPARSAALSPTRLSAASSAARRQGCGCGCCLAQSRAARRRLH